MKAKRDDMAQIRRRRFNSFPPRPFFLAFFLFFLTSCCAKPPERPEDVSALKVHFIKGGGLLVRGTTYYVIIREDGSVVVEVANVIKD